MEGTEETPVSEGVVGSKFTLVDYAVFAALLVVSVGIGVYSAFKSRGVVTTLEYLLGSRTMPVVPVALSLVGGAISAISILGNATEVYFYGTQVTMNLIGSIFGVLILRNVMLPVLFPLQLISMFEYIELRFKSRALRKMATGIQLVTLFVYMGISVYAPSLAVSSVTSLPIWASVLLMGLICSFYITIGGVKAVVYADVVQTLLMFAGVLVVSVICCQQLGGFANVWTIADQGGRLEFFNMDPSVFVRHTFWSTQVLGAYTGLSVAGLSQPQFQRFISVRTLSLSQSLCSFFIMGLFVLCGIFYFCGLVAYAVYNNCDPLTSGRITKPDEILPYLVTDKLNHLPGLSGLFVAAVYSGVLSSLSSVGHAIACVIWVDYLRDLPYFSNVSQRRSTNIVKILSTTTVMVGICIGLLVGELGTIFNVAYTLLGAIKGPLGGIFLVGICAPWVNKKGATVGVCLAFLFNMWLMIGKLVRGGGSPMKMPLSTLGCPENFNNTLPVSVINVLHNGLNDTFGFNFTTAAVPMTEGSGHTIYDISYCYSGITGIINTFIISTLVSFLTGPVAPQELEPRMVNSTCARVYERLWKLLVRDISPEPLSNTPSRKEVQAAGEEHRP
ncbi:sodium-coupled monocarboxylate transporter 1-like isoform X1 [Cherax quadricarinatus]|uniref:sodium-coupled monocarboxylate transporter 1-like isoform X1 n=1 Tax=Cherax quadricarinatus TaxID=27406 RepID=UPI00387E578C